MDLSRDEIRELNLRLDAEWDLDRWLHLLFGGGTMVSFFVGLFGHRRLRWLSVLMADLALWTAITGWSPLKALLQRVGVRTRAQIERERYVLLFGEEPPTVP